MNRILLISCALLLACGSQASPAEEQPSSPAEPGSTAVEAPDPGGPQPEALPAVELSPEFCDAYLSLRGLERELGSEQVSAGDVDQIIGQLRTLSDDAPEPLSVAFRATADIYQAERLRLVNNLIGLILIERRGFDDERDLLLQMNVVGDFMARSNCQMNNTNIADMVAADEAAVPAEVPEESLVPLAGDPELE